MAELKVDTDAKVITERAFDVMISDFEKQYCTNLRKDDRCLDCKLEDCICPESDIFETYY